MKQNVSTRQLRETVREADALPAPATPGAPAAPMSARDSDLDRLLAMETKVNEVRPDRLAVMPSKFQAAFLLAETRRELRAVFTPSLVKMLRELENTSLGFRCDRPNDKHGPYDDRTLIDCAIEALLRGLRLVGNEFNIICGQVYTTTWGLARLLSEEKGLTNLAINLGLPRVSAGGAVVSVDASWIYNEVPGGFKTEIAARLNAGMGADAAVGKVLRKARYRVWTTIKGSAWMLPEGEADEPAADAPAATDSAAGISKLIDKLTPEIPPKREERASGIPLAAPVPSPAPAPAGGNHHENGGGAGSAPAQREQRSADDDFAADIIASMDGTKARGPNASTVDITVTSTSE